MTSNPILTATALRSQGQNLAAIQHIEANLQQIEPDYRVLAYREAFLAARDAGDVVLAKSYATKIAQTDPDLPSIQGWL